MEVKMNSNDRKKVKIDNRIIKLYYSREPEGKWKDYRSFYTYFRWKFYTSKDTDFFIKIAEEQRAMQEAEEKAIQEIIEKNSHPQGSE